MSALDERERVDRPRLCDLLADAMAAPNPTTLSLKKWAVFAVTSLHYVLRDPEHRASFVAEFPELFAAPLSAGEQQ